MRRALFALLAGLLLSAQSPIAGFPPGAFQNRAALDSGVSAGSFGITYGSTVNDTSAQTTYTFSGVGFSTPFSNRYAVVSVCIRSTAALNTPTVTIDGNAATKVIESFSSTNAYSGLFQVPAPMTAGTSAAVVVSGFGTAAIRAAVNGYSVVTNTSAIPSGGSVSALAQVGSALQVTLTYPATSRAIMAMCNVSGSGFPSTVTQPPANVTLDVDAQIVGGGTENLSAHDTTSRTGNTLVQISTSASTATAYGVVAAWVP